MSQDKINQMQIVEQNMQQILMQKQQFQAQALEIDSALEQLEKTEDAYKIIGNIMVKIGKVELKKDLEENREKVGIRLKSIETQEKRLKERAESLRKEIMEELQKKESSAKEKKNREKE